MTFAGVNDLLGLCATIKEKKKTKYIQIYNQNNINHKTCKILLSVDLCWFAEQKFQIYIS